MIAQKDAEFIAEWFAKMCRADQLTVMSLVHSRALANQASSKTVGGVA